MTRFSIIIVLIILTSCKTSNRTTTYDKVKSGQDLEKINSISIDKFLNQWVSNKEIQKVDLNVRELNKDDQFTYFGKPSLLKSSKWTFFKVHTDTLTEYFPNYKDFSAPELRHHLWNEVIPKEEIELWNYNTTTQKDETVPNCCRKKNRPVFSYSLINKTVELTMTWEIDCEELNKLKNQKYTARYNLQTGQYENN